MIRCAIAIIGGYAAWTALWLIGSVVLIAAFSINTAAERIDDAGYLGSALALSVACSLLGGVVSRLVARGTPAAGWILGALLLLTGVVVQASAWSSMPVWYHLPFLVLLVPMTMAGFAIARGARQEYP